MPPSRLNKAKQEVLEAAREGRTLGDPQAVPPDEGLEYWAAQIAHRVKADKDALVLVTGPTGEGKSTLAMRLSLRVAKMLGTSWSPEAGLAYSAAELLSFYKRATESGERGQIAIVDEGAQALFSGDINNPDAKALIKAINLVRVSGCVVFLCVPDMMSIAKAMRVRLAHVWLAVRFRGLARCHVRERSVHYKPETTFGFSVSTKAPHVTWEAFPPEDPMWQAYLARKRENLLAYLREAEADVAGSRRAPRSTNAERSRRSRARKKQKSGASP